MLYNFSYVVIISWVNSGGEGNNIERDVDDSELMIIKK